MSFNKHRWYPSEFKVTYLGIAVSKNMKSRCVDHFPQLWKKTKTNNLWLHRDLSLKSRTLLSKAEGLSRLAYSATSHVDAQTSKTTDQSLFNFFMEKNTKQYINL